MADRNRGEKSTVRIARSSWEQNGYERHQTLPVPVSSGGTPMASRPQSAAPQKIGKPRKSSRGATNKFHSPMARLTHGCAASEDLDGWKCVPNLSHQGLALAPGKHDDRQEAMMI